MSTIIGPFQMQTASDVERDGLGVELIAANHVVAEVFRCDRDHSVTVNLFGNEIPLIRIQELITYARERLEPFEDGTPLPDCGLPSLNVGAEAQR